MPRVSVHAKKVFDLIWYNADIEQVKERIKELEDPLDIAFGKIWLAYSFLCFYKINPALIELKEAEEKVLFNQDKFTMFLVHSLYLGYYIGWNSPIVDIGIAKKYFLSFQKFYSEIEYVDDWERFFSEGWYYFSLANYVNFIENNLEKGIEYQRKSKEAWNFVPNDGEYLHKFFGNICVGYFLRLAGQFDEAENLFLIALEESEKYNCVWESFPLVNLINLNFQKGDLEKVNEWNERSLNLSKKLHDTFGIYLSLGIKSDYLFSKGNFDESLDVLLEALDNRKKHNDPLEISKGYAEIFNNHYKRFKSTRNKKFLNDAEQVIDDLKKISNQHPDDKTIKNNSIFSEACVLKYGNLNKRAKSVTMFEDLIKSYPYDFTYAMEYLELLFEDFMISQDTETVEKIDLLMKTIVNIPLTVNSIYSYVYQQIVLARYQFYVKNNISLSFEILTRAKDELSKFNIENINLKLDVELERMKSDRNLWDKIDISIKERIEKSEFKKYILDSLEITKLL